MRLSVASGLGLGLAFAGLRWDFGALAEVDGADSALAGSSTGTPVPGGKAEATGGSGASLAGGDAWEACSAGSEWLRTESHTPTTVTRSSAPADNPRYRRMRLARPGSTPSREASVHAWLVC